MEIWRISPSPVGSCIIDLPLPPLPLPALFFPSYCTTLINQLFRYSSSSSSSSSSSLFSIPFFYPSILYSLVRVLVLLTAIVSLAATR